MCTVVRLTWGRAPSCQPLCFIACVDCLFLPDLIKATGQYWNAHCILAFPFISHGFHPTAASLTTDCCSLMLKSQQGIFKIWNNKEIQSNKSPLLKLQCSVTVTDLMSTRLKMNFTSLQGQLETSYQILAIRHGKKLRLTWTTLGLLAKWPLMWSHEPGFYSSPFSLLS